MGDLNSVAADAFYHMSTQRAARIASLEAWQTQATALLRDYWFDLSDHENIGTQDWRRDRLKRISALLAGRPDAEAGQ